MSDLQKEKSVKPSWPESSEYEDALSDILEDQVRRKELRSAPAATSARPRLHAGIPPILAIISIWLWAFPPTVLQPEVPIIPPANQEAGLRMEMFLQFVNVQRYVSENGLLPNDLEEAGDGSDEVLYTREAGNSFRLTGRVGNVTVVFTSTEPVENLLGDAVAIVSGRMAPAPEGAQTP